MRRCRRARALRNLFGADEASELEVTSQRKACGCGNAERSDGGDGNTKLRADRNTFAMRSSTTAAGPVRSPGSPCGSCSLRAHSALAQPSRAPAQRPQRSQPLATARRSLRPLPNRLRRRFPAANIPRLKAELSQRMVAENFGAYAGESLCFPNDAALPSAFRHPRAFLGNA